MSTGNLRFICYVACQREQEVLPCIVGYCTWYEHTKNTIFGNVEFCYEIPARVKSSLLFDLLRRGRQANRPSISKQICRRRKKWSAIGCNLGILLKVSPHFWRDIMDNTNIIADTVIAFFFYTCR